MTDQIPADKVREIAARFRNQVQLHVPAAECGVWERAAEAVEALLPPPTPPTLADMTDEERAACTGMQADAETGERVIIIDGTERPDGRVQVLSGEIYVYLPFATEVTPRPDLPRMEWPGDKNPAPAPALPDGWRLADHKGYGSGIVTNHTPNRNGHVYFVIPADDDMDGRIYKIGPIVPDGTELDCTTDDAALAAHAPDMAAMRAGMREEWGVHVTGYPKNIADWAEICDSPEDHITWLPDEEAAEDFAVEREDEGYNTRIIRRYVTTPEEA